MAWRVVRMPVMTNGWRPTSRTIQPQRFATKGSTIAKGSSRRSTADRMTSASESGVPVPWPGWLYGACWAYGPGWPG